MNYIGSKLSLTPFLRETIGEVVGERGGETRVFADLFAGTGVVGAAFRADGWRVISNDIQFYSFVLNKHAIENVDSVDRSLFSYFNELVGIEGFVYKNYCLGSGSGRSYFSDENGKKCDAIRTRLETLRREKKLNDENYFFYLASLLESIDKYANTASVYGAFLKNVKKSAARPFQLEPAATVVGPPGKARNEDANALIRKIRGEVLYLDPPYNVRQYCANYHILETIALYDNPSLRGKTGLRSCKNQKSAFCSKRTVSAAFEDLLANADFKYVFLSYNNEGLMSLEDVRDIMSRFGRYEKYKTDYKRFRADKENARNHKAARSVEYLHCLIKQRAE